MRRALTLACLLAGGCIKTVAAPLPVPPSSIDDRNVLMGRTIYTARCNGCHGYPAPTAVRRDEWPKTIRLMGHRAALSDENAAAVFHYIMALLANEQP